MDQHLEMIKNEIYLLVKLKHPRVINVQSNFYVYGDNHIYIVMEYARNGSLMNLLHARRGKFLNGNVIALSFKKFYFHLTSVFLQEVLDYFTDILMGLEFLHMKGEQFASLNFRL